MTRTLADLADGDLVAVLDDAGRVMLTDRVSRVGRREINVEGCRYRLKDGTAVGQHWAHRDGDVYAARIRPAIDGDPDRAAVRAGIMRLTRERNLADSRAASVAGEVDVLRARIKVLEGDLARYRAASEDAIAELAKLHARAAELGDGGPR